MKTAIVYYSQHHGNTKKLLDAIADKVLVNSALIILAVRGFIPAIVPVIYVFRDEVVNSLKMDALTDAEKQIILKGCLINFYKN